MLKSSGARSPPTNVLVAATATTTSQELVPGRIPEWLQEKCSAVTVRTTRRPCPTYTCILDPKVWSAPCTTMPSSIAYPPESNGVSGCNWLIYTGIACTGCNDKYCNADKKCPIGLKTTTSSQYCGGGPRCGRPASLPHCPTTTPTYSPYPLSITKDCDVTVVTGTPCSGCASYCTLTPVAPAALDTRNRGCAGDLTTTTTERLCYSVCTFESYPTPCTAKPASGTPLTETFGCTAYVQTGTRNCPECLDFCTSKTALLAGPEITAST